MTTPSQKVTSKQKKAKERMKPTMKTHLVEQIDEYDEPHTLCGKMSPIDSAVWGVETFIKSDFRCNKCWIKYRETKV